ncbi:MAG: glycosyltransferase [Hapalosiphonaceae cyanobacterium JJU2]|nr:MAG: glycosyltransferase [Hapalosiphonaceae cyanobacterium JJU2]
MVSNQTNSLINEAFLPKVSVIVPVYNGEADIPDLISCLCVQTYPRDRVEYLLVDNASRDRTADIIKAASEDSKRQGLIIRYLSENQIQSSYAARNTGIRAATGDFLAFTDVDCRPQPNWLNSLIQPFVNPVVGLVAGSIEALPGKTLLEKYAAKNNPLDTEMGLSYPFGSYIVTANLAVRRQVFEQVGLFRSHLTTGGDADFSWRALRQTSWQYYYAKQALVLHRHRSTLSEFRSQWRRYGRSDRYLHELHGTELAPELTFKYYLYSLIGWLLKLPINTIKIIVGKATLVDILSVPIELIILQAKLAGQKEAKLPEEAQQIVWL